MKNVVVVLTDKDTYISLENWQREYGLEVGSNKIGKYFNLSEPRFKKDVEEYGKLIVCAPLMVVMDAYRSAIGESVTINSYNRDDRKQQELRASGFRAARSSPHVEKMAVDVDTRDEAHTRKNVPILKRAAKELGIPIRVGYMDYIKNDQSFIHFDVCPLYYAKGAIRYNEQHPPQWENEIEW